MSLATHQRIDEGDTVDSIVAMELHIIMDACCQCDLLLASQSMSQMDAATSTGMYALRHTTASGILRGRVRVGQTVPMVDCGVKSSEHVLSPN